MDEMTTKPMPVVIYGVKSSKDPHDSVPDQVRACRDAIAKLGDREVVQVFTETKKSGWKGNRGEALDQAMGLACELAEDHGAAELWVRMPNRFGRGSGRKGEARSLLEVFTTMRRQGVTLRSAEDDDYIRDGARIGMASDMANRYSEELSTAVRAGLRRAFDRGERGTGKPPDGFKQLADGTIEIDRERAAIITRIFDLAAEGRGDPSIARQLNQEGLRTAGRADRKPVAWTRRRVQDALTNPTYAGAVVWHRGEADEEVNWQGKHPALIDAESFKQLQAERAGRDRAVGSDRSPSRGRPPRNHALAGLATCNICLEVMRPKTSSYRRKDGSRARHYVCRHVADQTGLCDAPKVDAETVDRYVIAELDRYLGDLKAWKDRFLANRDAERIALLRQLECAGSDYADIDRTVKAVTSDYEKHVVSGEEAKVDAVLEILTEKRRDQVRVERRIRAIEDAIAALPSDPPADAMLDFYNDLSAAVRGRLDRAGRQSMGRVNEALKEIFGAFIIDAVDAPEEGIVVVPVLKGRTWEGTPDDMLGVATGDEVLPPPLKNLRTTRAKSASSQEIADLAQGTALPTLVVPMGANNV